MMTDMRPAEKTVANMTVRVLSEDRERFAVYVNGALLATAVRGYVEPLAVVDAVVDLLRAHDHDLSTVRRSLSDRGWQVPASGT
jgi:hypothetical protein